MTSNDTELRRARTLARALDTAIGIPGTPVRFGLDAILGLIPGAGDVVAAALSSYIVIAAVRRGAPASVIWRMLANVGIDTLVGALPVLGDLFDVAYKSNTRNVALLERYVAEPGAVATRSRLMIVGVVITILLLATGIATVGFLVARWLFQLLGG